MNPCSYFSKEIEGKLDTVIEYKIHYFDSKLFRGLTNSNYLWKKIEKWKWYELNPHQL